jgi:alanyl-tRNA synthetase
MRRAMRHAHILGAKEPLMYQLAPTLIAEMGEAYPELKRAQPVIEAQLREEEERFRRTLAHGLKLLEEELGGLKKGQKLSGRTAFKLHDTFGFPLDLTQDILRGRSLEVDLAEYDAAMQEQKDQGAASWKGADGADNPAIWHAMLERTRGNEFLGYGAEAGDGKLAAIVAHGEEQHDLREGATGALVFDRTPFYAESGGQAGDYGVIRFANGAEFTVEGTQKQAGALHAHIGRLTKGAIKVGDKAKLNIDHARRAAIRANHSATHLVHAALRNVLGPHVTQKGSLVEADYFRFDFSHGQALSTDEIGRVEDEVNAVIRQNAEGVIKEMSPEKAIAEGALALFGEKYGDSVRVLRLGDALGGGGNAYSVELCGGTHVKRTGDIAVFAILSEGGVAAGVRRIEAATGAAALAHL